MTTNATVTTAHISHSGVPHNLLSGQTRHPIQALEERLKEGQIKLQQLSESRGDAWDSARPNVESALTSLKSGLREAAANFLIALISACRDDNPSARTPAWCALVMSGLISGHFHDRTIIKGALTTTGEPYR